MRAQKSWFNQLPQQWYMIKNIYQEYMQNPCMGCQGKPTWVNAYISRAIIDDLIHVQPDAVNGTHLIQSLHKLLGLPMRPVKLTLHSPPEVH